MEEIKQLSIKEKAFIEHMKDVPWALDLSDDELLSSNACSSIRLHFFSGFEECQNTAIRILSQHKININIIKEIFDLDEKMPHY